MIENEIKTKNEFKLGQHRILKSFGSELYKPDIKSFLSGVSIITEILLD
jgi:hypothetical protein